jgi:hypothetical protein
MENSIHKQGKKYDNEEDRRRGYLDAQRRYNLNHFCASEKWECKLCNKTLSLRNKYHHVKTKRHLNNQNTHCTQLL